METVGPRDVVAVLAERAEELRVGLARLLADDVLTGEISAAVDRASTALLAGRTILFAGNGGSSMDAGHFAAELTGRFTREGKALAAISLADPVAALTAIGNDYGYEQVFARLVEALGRPGDVLILLTTSGRSPNIIRAAEQARRREVAVVTICGAAPGDDLVALSTHMIRLPSTDTPRVQEMTGLVGHVLCELLESRCRTQ